MMIRRIALGVVGCLGAAAMACSGSAGPAGPQGQPGTAGSAAPGGGTASISGIEPSTAFLARQPHVTISGYATSWTDKTTIDFGAGITVSNVHAASPTALVADLVIDKAAALGPRDVVVDDTTKETYSQGFTVSAPAVMTLQGTLAQGGIAFANLQLQDTSTPFDTTGSQDPLSGEITYTNLALTAPAGVTASINTATSNSVQILLTLDVDAVVGAADLDLLSGPAGDTTDALFPVAGGLTVTAQTATALGATPVSGNVKAAYDSALYSFAPASASLAIVDLTANSAASGANAGFALLPKSGHFADLLGFYEAADGAGTSATTTLLPSSTDPYYLIYWDNSGTTGAYTIGATSTAPASTLATTAADATIKGALSVTALPFVLTGGNLTSDTSIDWVKITTGTGDAGKVIHVQTEGDPYTDVAVAILESDGTTAIGGDDEGAPIDTTSTAVTASTTYYVTFAAGQLDFDPSDGTYSAIIRLE
ncbi:MAG TPA: hypothetical protein VGL81_27055 [Polyangiaceae bacterium]|jgi:hypothetical protein